MNKINGIEVKNVGNMDREVDIYIPKEADALAIAYRAA